jgi:hypothetical protein
VTLCPATCSLTEMVRAHLPSVGEGRTYPHLESRSPIARSRPRMRFVAVALAAPRQGRCRPQHPPVCAQGHGGPKGRSATEDPQSAKGNAAAEATQFCWSAQERASTRLSPGILGSGGCNDGRPANALYGRWCLPRIPPGASPALGLLPCRERTLCGVRVWCWPRVPTEAMGWTVGTRGTSTPSQGSRAADPRPSKALAPPGRLGTDSLPKRRSCRSSRIQSRAGEHPAVTPPSRCCRAVVARMAALPVGHAQPDL